MAANEFERSMRKAMDEFRLHPSNEVWDKVEERIRERKRKRRIIFFTILSCVGLAIGGYAIREQATRNKLQATSDKQQAASNKGQTNSSEQQATSNKQRSSAKATGRDATSNLQPATSNQQPATSDEQLATNNQKLTTHKNQPITSNQQPATSNQQPATSNQQPATSNQQPVTSNQQPVTSNQQPVTSNQQPVTSNQQPVTSNQQPVTSNHHPKFGFYVSLGSSSIKQDPIASLFSTNADKALQTGSYVPPGSATGSPAPPHPQSKSQGSFAFRAGVSAQKKISKRSELKVGIGYAFMGDRITTGTANTSNAYVLNQLSVTSFFGSDTGQHRNFTDRFHFIEVPIAYQWRVTGNSKHFLALEAGFTPSYLFSSNALVYDTAATGIYYHHNKNFSKFNVSMMAGVSYRFITNSMDINLGPQISLPLNKIIKSDIDQRNYLIYGGIGATIYFQKKKKG